MRSTATSRRSSCGPACRRRRAAGSRRLRRQLARFRRAASTRRKCYTEAYSVFGLKCIIAPEVPEQRGLARAVRDRRAGGTCVAPLRPAPVTARHVIGQMLPDLMFGCLPQALDGQVPAESAGSIWVPGDGGRAGRRRRWHAVQRDERRPRRHGRPAGQGRPSTHRVSQRRRRHPGGDHGGPVAAGVLAQGVPARFRRRRPVSRRPRAAHRDRRPRWPAPFTCDAATFDRLRNPARGRDGGADGAPGQVFIESASGLEAFTGKGTIRRAGELPSARGPSRRRRVRRPCRGVIRRCSRATCASAW